VDIDDDDDDDRRRVLVASIPGAVRHRQGPCAIDTKALKRADSICVGVDGVQLS
jgi:hypothetical protein